MNYVKKRLALYICFLLLGVACIVYLISFEPVNSHSKSFIYGLVGGFIVPGILGILNSIKLLKTPKKAEEITLLKNEERTIFIREKTNSLVFSISIFVESIGTILCGVLGYPIISLTLASLLMLKVILWVMLGNYYFKKY